MARRSTAIRILGAFALASMTLAGGCYDAGDDILIAALTWAFSVNADGGSAAANDGSTVGQGGNGGSVTAVASGELSLGHAGPPARPVVPSAPTTGDTPLLDGTDTNPPSGNWLIGGTITTSAAGAVTLTTNTGDIIVSGTIIGEDLGATRADVTLNAPNGTVYVTGRIDLSGAAGDSGGTLTLNARQIVVTGALDTSGGAGSGPGTGGNVNLIASSSDIYSLLTITCSGADSTTTGGNGGTINFDAANGNVYLYGTYTFRGGAATDPAGGCTGGNAGNLNVNDAERVCFDGVMDGRGGEARTTGTGAAGGPGANVNFPGDASLFVFGSINVSGGDGRANAGPITGGIGGRVFVGDLGGFGTRASFIQGGTPTFTAKGGSGGADGGLGGDLRVGLEEGIARIKGIFDFGGGSATGTNANGGSGGTIEFRNGSANPGGNTRPRRYEFMSGSVVRADGAAGNGTGDGGNGGSILVFVSENILTNGVLTADGGDSFDGTGGQGGDITFEANSWDHSNLLIGGTVSVTGGSSTLFDGNDGGTVDLILNGTNSGDIEITGSIDMSGGDGNFDAGQGGVFTGATEEGHAWVLGTIRSRGGNGGLTPDDGGTIDLQAFGTSGDVLVSGDLDVSGGDGTDTSTDLDGGNGGQIILRTNGANAPLVLSSGSSIRADGGTGTRFGFGGTGGQVTVAGAGATARAIVAGRIRARGGASSSSGVGGNGGRVVVSSNNGTIRVDQTGTIDASGGFGSGGGAAFNNAGAGGTPGSAAVELDADPADAAAPSGGTVINNGSITANAGTSGAAGGDVLFDGNDGAGGAPVAGTQSRTGSPAGDFDNDVP